MLGGRHDFTGTDLYFLPVGYVNTAFVTNVIALTLLSFIVTNSRFDVLIVATRGVLFLGVDTVGSRVNLAIFNVFSIFLCYQSFLQLLEGLVDEGWV